MSASYARELSKGEERLLGRAETFDKGAAGNTHVNPSKAIRAMLVLHSTILCIWQSPRNLAALADSDPIISRLYCGRRPRDEFNAVPTRGVDRVRDWRRDTI